MYHFTLDTAIPYGNACDVSLTEGPEAVEVAFAAHPHGGPESLWFCFRVTRAAPGEASGQPMRLLLKHPHNLLGGHPLENLRPVIRYADADWQRLPAGDVEELPDGRSRVAWGIDAPARHVDVACCYPYGRPEVDALVAGSDGYWRADTIGVSQAGRPLLRLSNDYGRAGGDRPGLYLMARQHSGETPGSWVLDGFLRQIAALGDGAPLVWAVPLSNIDGVEEGDYGKDNFPYDLNRAWGTPPMRHETLVLQQDLRRWKQRCRPVLALDFHAPGACEASGIYTFIPDPEKTPEEHARTRVWTQAIAGALTPNYAAADFERVARYRSRWETPSFIGYCREQQELCGVTLEVPYALAGEQVFTRERYRQAGERVARVITTSAPRAELIDVVAARSRRGDG